MQEKILNSSLKEYKIEIESADINIYSSNVIKPIIKYNGTFDIKDDGSILKIKQIFQKSKKGFNFRKIFGRQVITMDGCKIIKKGNSITVLGNGGNISQINGRTFFNGIEITDDMCDNSNNLDKSEKFVGEPYVDLILPFGKNDISLDLKLIRGDIDISGLILNRLIVNNKNGDINLNDVDAVMAKIELMNGAIKAEIAESIINYSLSLKTVNGSSNQSTIENFETMPTLLKLKHKLNINNVNGDIDVIFKGKK